MSKSYKSFRVSSLPSLMKNDLNSIMAFLRVVEGFLGSLKVSPGVAWIFLIYFYIERMMVRDSRQTIIKRTIKSWS